MSVKSVSVDEIAIETEMREISEIEAIEVRTTIVVEWKGWVALCLARETNQGQKMRSLIERTEE